MDDNEIKLHFNKEEWKRIPLTVKTTKKINSTSPTTEEVLQTDTEITSGFHSTKKYSSHTFYKPVSSLFYE